MKLNPQSKLMLRQLLAVSITTTLTLAAAGPLRAATSESVKTKVATDTTTKPARQCLTDLSAFHLQMQKDGYWGGTSAYGYGYPMYGYGYYGTMGSPAMGSTTAPGSIEYSRARPGFEVRTLLASAQILAQRGQQASCEALLSETREIYGKYAAELRSGNVPRYDIAGYRQAQVASAKSVADQNISYSSDQLIGTEVLNSKGEELGSVDDMVHSPMTGKIAYLVIARGGLFGINEKFVPVPWTDFKATTGAKMLVLGTTKEIMSAAPQIKANRFTTDGDFNKQSQLVDAYWSSHPTK